MDELLRWAQTATADELRAKVEELADTLQRASVHVPEWTCMAVQVRNALRAPGGATGKHPVVEGNRGSIAQKHDNEAVSPSRESRRAPGGGER